MADVLACGPEARTRGETSAALWRVRPATRRRTQVITPKRGRRKPKGIDLRTTRSLEEHETAVIDGIPTTSLERTLEDLAAQIDQESLESAFEHAVVNHGLDPASLAECRSKRLRTLARDFQRGTALTRSDIEALFRRITKDLPQPRSNQPLWAGDRHYYPDFYWPEHRLVVEIDGWSTHRSRTEADRRREAHLSELGLTVQRFTRLQLLRRPREVRQTLRPFLDASWSSPQAAPASRRP